MPARGVRSHPVEGVKDREKAPAQTSQGSRRGGSGGAKFDVSKGAQPADAPQAREKGDASSQGAGPADRKGTGLEAAHLSHDRHASEALGASALDRQSLW